MVSTASNTTPRVAIVGGGVSGLVLLLTLHRRGVPATLYEREAGFSDRAHLGGTLDLEWASGQRALRENGLQEEFDKHSRPEGQEIKIGGADGQILLSRGAIVADPKKKRPEIDRSVLRQILLDAVPSEYIKWGHGLTSARALDGGKHELTFSNGVVVECDVLVGADGANSRIRPLLSPATPIYAGITGAEVSIAPDIVVRDDLQETRELVGHGSLFSVENNKYIGAQINGDGRIRTYAWFRGPEDWRLPQRPDEARKALLDLFQGWSPRLLKLIECCDDEAIYMRPLYHLPIGHRWEHVPGVTLIGDAAHLMTPFAGAGANMAMLDGLELGLALADAISAGRTDEKREAAIAASEELMFKGAGFMAAKTKTNMDAFLNLDAPQTTLKRAREWVATGWTTGAAAGAA